MNVPLADKEIGMLKFDYPEDYTGTNLNHRKISEKRKLTDATSRLVTLDYGSFFAESLVIRNVATGRPLTPGKDYACVELDTLATERSGKQVCAAILIENQQVSDIEIDYIFVGGLHLSGLHLLKELKNIYPNGLEPHYHFDNILNKPETYKAKAHNTHVKELYGFDGLTRSLQEMIDGLGYKDHQYIDVIFSQVLSKLNSMNVELDEFITNTEESLNNAFEDFRIQDNEFIFTNTKENPAIKRGYGNWVLVNNAILKGDNSSNTYAVGHDSVISLGTKQIVTNCFVWKNESSSKTPTFNITSPPHGNLNPAQRLESEDIIFNIATTNLAKGSKIQWALVDVKTGQIADPYHLSTPPLGEVTVDETGTGKVIVKFKPNTVENVENKTYKFQLLNIADVFYTFTLLDTSAYKQVGINFTVDAAGKHPVTQVNEGQEFFLQIRYLGEWQRGEVVFFDWSLSGIPFEKIIGAPLTGTVPSSPTETFSLKVRANSLVDDKQAIIVYALESLKDEVASDKPFAQITVIDTSKFAYASLSFNDLTSGLTNVARVDEDSNFEIVIDTNLPSTELNLIYKTTKPISDFDGLRSVVTTNSQGKAIINATTLADFLTNIGAQSITVTVEVNNTAIGYNTLFINDTSKTPNYEVFFSKENISQVITTVNEGEKFFLNIRVSGWQAGGKAPALEFNYTLDEVNNTAMESLKARIASTFYPAMLFGQSSQTYDEISWVNGNTLRMEFTAIADKLVGGDTKFGVMVKQSNQSHFDKVSYLTIYDTSIPTVVGSWSSSAVTLTPITQVNEMQANGLNQRCYLWIDIDGDGASFGDITLKSNSANGVDFVTLFPNVIKLANGVSRHIVTVDAKADFVAEGNKNLFVAGSYKNDRGQDVELFRSTITLVDNSILTELNGVTSTSPSTVIAAPSGFSEWVPFYVHLDYPAFAFDTQIEWQVTFTSNPGANNQLESLSGTIEVSRNTARSILTLTPIKDRLKDGESVFNLSFKRKIKTTGQYITADKQITGIKILDDSLPMSVELKLYIDAARTTLAGSTVNEGTKLYARAIVSNPDKNYSISFGVVDKVARTGKVGATTVGFLPYTAVPARLDIADRKVVDVITATPGAFTKAIDVEFTVVADRTTNASSNPEAFAIAARVYDNTSNMYPLNTVVGIDTATEAMSVVEFALNDTSKTATYSVDAPVSVNENQVFNLKLDMTNATIGDVFYPVWVSGTVAASRVSSRGMGEEQLAATASGTINWNFIVNPDYKTTGPLEFVIGIMNKTTGLMVITKKISVADTSVEPIMKATISQPSDIIWGLTTIYEGATNYFCRIDSTNNQLTIGEQVKVEWVSGRPASEFNAEVFKTHIVTTDGNGSNNFIQFPIILPFDRKTNTAAENKLTIKVTAMNSGKVQQFTFDIDDISQTPGISSAVWKNEAGQTINSIREGEVAILEVKTTGGRHPYDITLTNDGGRSISRLDSHQYGVKRTRTTDDSVLTWAFRPKIDHANNTGVETMLKVKLTASAGNVALTYTLPIYDNSRNNTGSIEFHPDNSTTPITKIFEGKYFGVAYRLSDPDPEGQYHLKLTSVRANDGYLIDLSAPLVNFLNIGGGQYQYKLQRNTSYNDTNNTAAELLLNAELWDTVNNRLLASNTLTLVDTSRSNLGANGVRLTAVNGTTQLASINEGSSFDIYVPASSFADINWAKETMKVVLSYDAPPLAQYIFNISQASLRADGSYRTTVAIPADEKTAADGQWIQAILYTVFTGENTETNRAVSARMVVNDTSPLPTIDSVFLSKSNAANATAVTSLDEGDTFYVHVLATGLNSTGANVNIALNWDGTSSAGDFNVARPTSISMTLVNATTRQYRGVSGPIGIVEDNQEG